MGAFHKLSYFIWGHEGVCYGTVGCNPKLLNEYKYIVKYSVSSYNQYKCKQQH